MPTFQSKNIQTSAGHTHVTLTGQGPDLLLIHGALVSHKEWLLLLPYLTPHFRCILPDLPGFGESDKPHPNDFSYTREKMAKVLVETLDALDVKKAHVCGHSMGGSIALTFASLLPERIEKLAVIDSVSFPFEIPPKGKLALMPTLGPLIFYFGYRRIVFQDYFKKEVFFNQDKIDWKQINLYYDIFSPIPARRAAYANLKHTVDLGSLLRQISAIETNTLILWGEKDVLIPIEVGRRLHSALANSEFVAFENCGHAPNEEMPRETSQLLIKHFLGNEIS